MTKSEIIFINASTTLLSGGKIVATDIIEALINKNKFKLVVCSPNIYSYSKYKQQCAFLPVPTLLLHPLFRWALDFFWLPYAIKVLNPDIVFSLTNLPVKTKKKQLFYHDNPFVTNDFSNIKLSCSAKFIHRLRKYLFIKRSKYVATFITQTDLEKQKLSSIISKTKDIYVVTPLLPLHVRDILPQENPMVEEKKIIYPARYYTHKNIEFLLELAKYNSDYNFDVKFYITLDKKHGSGAKRILKEIKNYTNIFNLGELIPNDVSKAIQQMDAVILPSKLETYGLNSIEAWRLEKPLFSSNLPYAHNAYKGAAVLLDIENAQASLKTIKRVLNDKIEQETLISKGLEKIAQLSTIDDITIIIEKTISTWK